MICYRFIIGEGAMIKDMNDKKPEMCSKWLDVVLLCLQSISFILILLLPVIILYFHDSESNSGRNEKFEESSGGSFYVDNTDSVDSIESVYSVCDKYCLTPDMFIRFRDYLYNSDFEGVGVYRLKFKDVEEVSQSIGLGSVYDEVYSSDVAGWVIRSFMDKGYTELESYALYVYGNTDSIESKYFMRYISGGNNYGE